LSDSSLSAFTAADGDRLVVQDWPLPEGVRMRGVVLIVHGLGEHAGRYDHVAERLNQWGFMVRGYDQHGHGESGGEPGCLSTDTQLLDDLADIVDSTRMHMDERLPLILLGHSLGGLVAARLVAQRLRPVDGLVLSSPALDPGLNTVEKWLLRVLPRLAPDLRIGNGLENSFLSHDPAVVAAYRADPLVHDRISMRLARFIAESGPRTLALAPQWRVPTLLMFAGDDRLVQPAGSRAFAAAAPPALVTAKCFETLYHEIFNERGNEAVFELLRNWLDTHFPAAPREIVNRR
jgi:alpha-beta hydrolase superfamily lysophospholipase